MSLSEIKNVVDINFQELVDLEQKLDMSFTILGFHPKGRGRRWARAHCSLNLNSFYFTLLCIIQSSSYESLRFRLKLFWIACHTWEHMIPRRASVLFKSFSHNGIFVVERNWLNLPGGKVKLGWPERVILWFGFRVSRVCPAYHILNPTKS